MTPEEEHAELNAPFPDIEVYYRDLLAHEGLCQHMYLDTKGYVTVGIGQLIPNAEYALSLIMMAQEEPERLATHSELVSEFVRVQSKGQAERAPYHPANYYAAPRGRLALLMSVEVIEATCRTALLHRYIPAIIELVPGFMELPQGPRRALVDIAWNTGSLHGWPRLTTAVNAGDWATCRNECIRGSDPTTARNVWTVAQFSL